MGGGVGTPEGARLLEAFRAGLAARRPGAPGDLAPAPTPPAPALERCIAEAEATWPGVRVDRERFAAYLGARSQGLDPLAALCVDDLYIACACAAGSAEALRAFDRCYLDRIDGFVRRFDAAPAFVDEVRQTLRRKLFVADPPAPAKIADYSGRGALASWVGVAAQRVAVSLLRGRRTGEVAVEDEVAGELAADADPELEYARARYRADFRDALGQALTALPSDERALLRLYYVGGLSLHKLAQLKQVSFATVSRRLERSRRAIARHMKATLEVRLRLSAAEFTSLARLVRSSLEVSLYRMLHETGSA
jgi:RNA polymerase sigma-70 factor (ECF subfamily)